jgi:hypothetical protein
MKPWEALDVLNTVKLAIPVKTDYYDAELNSLIAAAVVDLGIVGVHTDINTNDAALTRAIVTYVKANFGNPTNYDQLKASYDEQKAQLITARGYGLEE